MLLFSLASNFRDRYVRTVRLFRLRGDSLQLPTRQEQTKKKPKRRRNICFHLKVSSLQITFAHRAVSRVIAYIIADIFDNFSVYGIGGGREGGEHAVVKQAAINTLFPWWNRKKKKFHRRKANKNRSSKRSARQIETTLTNLQFGG